MRDQETWDVRARVVGYVRDQGSQGSVGWVYERPGILGQRWLGT